MTATRRAAPLNASGRAGRVSRDCSPAAKRSTNSAKSFTGRMRIRHVYSRPEFHIADDPGRGPPTSSRLVGNEGILVRR
jgi:hypothetical protein